MAIQVEPRWLSVARGAVASYLLGILIGGTWDVRLWSEAAYACAVAFFCGWVCKPPH